MTQSIYDQAIAFVHRAGLGVQYRTGPRYGQQLATARKYFLAEAKRLAEAAGENRWTERIAEAKRLSPRT